MDVPFGQYKLTSFVKFSHMVQMLKRDTKARTHAYKHHDDIKSLLSRFVRKKQAKNELSN